MKVESTSKIEPATGVPTPGAQASGLFLTLGSAKMAVLLVIILGLACVAATLLPQGPAASAYFAPLPHGERWTAVAAALGFTHIFSSWWFIGLLFILASGVSVCAACRLAVARRATGVEIRRAFASALTHLSLLLILAGGIVRSVWGESGWLTLREGETSARFLSASRPCPLPFAIRFERTRVETEPVLKPVASAAPLVGSALKNVSSIVSVTERGGTASEVIAINAPLVRAGYRIYQVTDPAHVSGPARFQVVRDPGMPLVYAGFGLLLAGLVFTLYINPWLKPRRTIA